MKNNGLKNAKAITLIAMVVTIIVLLILAGVSIAVLTGENGILNRATSAKQTHEEKTEEEKLKLGVLALSTEYRSQTTHTYPKFSGFVESKVADLAEELGIPSSRITVNTTDDTLTYIINEKENKYTLDALGGIIDYVIPTMTKDESGVGCFIKKGDEYAIVFADRVAQSEQSANWSNTNNSKFTFPTVTESQFKTYIKGENYTDPSGKWGTHSVIEVVNNSGEDRFVALALDDYPSTATTSKWYDAADGQMEDPPTQTSRAFLSGKANTETMLKKGIAGTNGGYGALTSYDVWYKLMNGWTDTMKTSWTANGYGATSSSDAWGTVKNGWFIPSFEEWVAFAVAMKENKFESEDYSSLGFSDFYWSSSQSSTNSTWRAAFYNDYMSDFYVYAFGEVRLATTF